MEFDFKKDSEILEAEKVVEKKWGGEIWITNNEQYCQKFLYIKKGWRFSLQYHKNKHETFHLLEGRVYLELQKNPDFSQPAYKQENSERVLVPGATRVIPPYQIHRASALENSVILETSTHNEDSDTYRIYYVGEFYLYELTSNLKKRNLM